MKKLSLARFLSFLLSWLPSPNKIHPRKKDAANPFFIISAGRSGSTLLNRILNEHERLFLPSEQYFLGPSILKYKIYKPIIWRDLVKIVVGELAKPFQSHTWEMSEYPVYQKLIATPKAERSLQLIIQTIFTEYGLQHNKTSFRWGDSTPLNAHYIKEIKTLFPKASYLFLIRDGREVVSSYYKGGYHHFGELADPLKAAVHWNKSVQVLDYLRKSKCSLLLAKYEDMVLRPADALQKICNFLKIDFDEKMLNHYRNIPNTEFYNQEYQQKIKLPIVHHPEKLWDSTFSEEQKAGIFSLISHNLKRLGYL